jgi:hypothetical protein
VPIETHSAAPVALFGLVSTRQGDEPDPLAEHVAQRLGERPSVDDRHAEIKNAATGDARPQHQAGFSIIGRVDLMAGHLEAQRQRVTCVRFPDYEHSILAARIHTS